MEDNQKTIGHYLLGAILLVAAVCTVSVLFGGRSESSEDRIVLSLEPYQATSPVRVVPDRSSSPVIDPSGNQNQSADAAEPAGLEFFLAPAGTGPGELESVSRNSLRPLEFQSAYIQEAKSFELGSTQLINLILNDEGRLRLQQLSAENNLRDHGNRVKMVIAMVDGRAIASSTFKQPTDEGHLVLATALPEDERKELVNRINEWCREKGVKLWEIPALVVLERLALKGNPFL